MSKIIDSLNQVKNKQSLRSQTPPPAASEPSLPKKTPQAINESPAPKKIVQPAVEKPIIQNSQPREASTGGDRRSKNPTAYFIWGIALILGVLLVVNLLLTARLVKTVSSSNNENSVVIKEVSTNVESLAQKMSAIPQLDQTLQAVGKDVQKLEQQTSGQAKFVDDLKRVNTTLLRRISALEEKYGQLQGQGSGASH
jgi:hypothetical protein